MFERFTDGAQRALGIAQEKAKKFGHDYVGTEHLLLGLLEEDDSVASKALHSLGLEDKATEKAVLDAVAAVTAMVMNCILRRVPNVYCNWPWKLPTKCSITMLVPNTYCSVFCKMAAG